jgi:leucyl-tRNA synthetase
MSQTPPTLPDNLRFADLDCECTSCDNSCIPEDVASSIDYAKPLAGSVKPYHKHILFCTGSNSHNTWPQSVEKQDESVPQALSARIKEVLPKSERCVLTACTKSSEGCNDPDLKQMDLLVFPDAVRVSDVTTDNISEFVSKFVWTSDDNSDKENSTKDAENKVCDGLSVSNLPEGKHYIFICGHVSRDKRCGVLGPMLQVAFRKELKALNLEDQVEVHLCSHVGGHAYAGNVIMYPGKLVSVISAHDSL